MSKAKKHFVSFCIKHQVNIIRKPRNKPRKRPKIVKHKTTMDPQVTNLPHSFMPVVWQIGICELRWSLTFGRLQKLIEGPKRQEDGRTFPFVLLGGRAALELLSKKHSRKQWFGEDWRFKWKVWMLSVLSASIKHDSIMKSIFILLQFFSIAFTNEVSSQSNESSTV